MSHPKLKYYIQRLQDKVAAIEPKSSTMSELYMFMKDEWKDDDKPFPACTYTSPTKYDDIYFDTATQLIHINKGMSFPEMYRQTKNHWRNNEHYIAYPFPFICVHQEIFMVVGGWNFANSSIKHIHSAGWIVYDKNENIIEQYTGIMTLGRCNDAQLKYSTDGHTFTNFSKKGSVNEAIPTLNATNILIRAPEQQDIDVCRVSGVSNIGPSVIRVPVFVP